MATFFHFLQNSSHMSIMTVHCTNQVQRVHVVQLGAGQVVTLLCLCLSDSVHAEVFDWSDPAAEDSVFRPQTLSELCGLCSCWHMKLSLFHWLCSWLSLPLFPFASSPSAPLCYLLFHSVRPSPWPRKVAMETEANLMQRLEMNYTVRGSYVCVLAWLSAEECFCRL